MSSESDSSFEDIELRPLMPQSAPAPVATHPAFTAPRQPRVTYATVALPDPPSYVQATGVYHAEDHFELGPAYPGARGLHLGNWIGLRIGLVARGAFNLAIILPSFMLAGAIMIFITAGLATLMSNDKAGTKEDAASMIMTLGMGYVVNKGVNDFKRSISASPDQNRRVIGPQSQHEFVQAARAMVGLPTKDYESK